MNNENIKTADELVRERNESSLQELNQQLLRSEIQLIADKTEYTWYTVNEYLKGSAPSNKRAINILKVGRDIIKKREHGMHAA